MSHVPQFTRLLVPDHELRDVREFMLKFGQLVHLAPVHLTKRKLGERSEFLQEELDEFKAAVETQDLSAMADALIDLVYVAKGTAIMLGLPWEALWADVHRANMAKVRGVTHRGHAVDCKKPEGWAPPQTLPILLDANYIPVNFRVDGSLEIDEEKCHDDVP